MERPISWLHQHHRLRVRWERRDDIHEALMTIACSLSCFTRFSAQTHFTSACSYRPCMAADARVVWMPGGVRTEIHLAAEDTGGAFCLLVDHPPAGWSLPAHRHHNEAETIHIVHGDFEMEIHGQRSHLSAGETIHVPRGVIHSGANVGQQPGHRVVLFSPAGMERFFLEAGAPTPDSETDLAAALASATRHGWEFITEP